MIVKVLFIPLIGNDRTKIDSHIESFLKSEYGHFMLGHLSYLYRLVGEEELWFCKYYLVSEFSVIARLSNKMSLMRVRLIRIENARRFASENLNRTILHFSWQVLCLQNKTVSYPIVLLLDSFVFYWCFFIFIVTILN